MAMSPGDTAGLDQFEIGEGISPGGNEELLDSLIDIADENSPRGPGLAPPHTVTTDAVSLEIDEDEESLSSYASSSYESGSPEETETGSETGSSSYESYTGSSSASASADESALSADEDSNFGSDDIPASAYAGAAGAVTAGATVAEPHSGELDYNGPELAHSAELDYQGADDLPELLPREAAQAPAPRGFARPGDLSAGGGVV